MATHGQPSHAPLASLAVHWHACKGDIPPPLVVSLHDSLEKEARVKD